MIDAESANQPPFLSVALEPEFATIAATLKGTHASPLNDDPPDYTSVEVSIAVVAAAPIVPIPRAVLKA